jgi:hypothetical protein
MAQPRGYRIANSRRDAHARQRSQLASLLVHFIILDVKWHDFLQ